MRFAFIAKHRNIWQMCAHWGMAMRGSGCLPVGLSRLAQPQPQCACSARRCARDGDRPKLQEQRSYLWRTTRLARCAGGRVLLRAASGRTDHAGAWVASPATPSWAAEGCRRAGRRVGQSARPRLRGLGPEPEMGGGLHLHLDRGRLALRCRRRRPVLPACRRLGNEGGNDGPARHRCSHHGDPRFSYRASTWLQPSNGSVPRWAIREPSGSTRVRNSSPVTLICGLMRRG